MTHSTPGQMTWRPNGATSTDRLYLRYRTSDPWQPYTDFPDRALPDPPGFSSGYATFLTLLEQNWQVIC